MILRRAFRILPYRPGLWCATCLSLVLGALSPLVKAACIRLLPFSMAVNGAIFFLLAVGVAGLLYRRTTLTGPILGGGRSFLLLLPFSVFIVCLWASVWCYREHICMGGHMQHPPYPDWHRFADASWAVSLLGVPPLLAVIRSPAAVAAGFICGFLVSYRFLCGSFGGFYILIPL